jgi:hypothetical protein
MLREFNFNTLLIQLTTSLTLLAAATVITDLVALYLLPDSEVYEKSDIFRMKSAVLFLI